MENSSAVQEVHWVGSCMVRMKVWSISMPGKPYYIHVNIVTCTEYLGCPKLDFLDSQRKYFCPSFPLYSCPFWKQTNFWHTSRNKRCNTRFSATIHAFFLLYSLRFDTAAWKKLPKFHVVFVADYKILVNNGFFFPYLNHVCSTLIYHRWYFSCYIDVVSSTLKELYVCVLCGNNITPWMQANIFKSSLKGSL